MEPIIRKTKAGIRILLFITLVSIAALIIWLAFTSDEGWFVKLTVVLLAFSALLFAPPLLSGKLPPSLEVNSDGIKIDMIRESFIPWSDVAYISKISHRNKKMAEKLDALTDEEADAMDGQELEELEAFAQAAGVEGIYIGTADGEEYSLNYFFRKHEFEGILRKLTAMWRYTNHES